MSEKDKNKFGIMFIMFTIILIAAGVATCMMSFTILGKIRDIVILVIMMFGYLVIYTNVAAHGFGDKVLRAAAIGMVYAILLVKWTPDMSPAFNVFCWLLADIWTGTATFLCIELVYALAALASK